MNRKGGEKMNNNNNNNNTQSVLNSNLKLLQSERIPIISFTDTVVKKRKFIIAQAYRYLINLNRQRNKKH